MMMRLPRFRSRAWWLEERCVIGRLRRSHVCRWMSVRLCVRLASGVLWTVCLFSSAVAFLEQVGARRGLFLSSSLTQKRKEEEYEKRLQEMQENPNDLSFWNKDREPYGMDHAIGVLNCTAQMLACVPCHIHTH